MYEQAALFTKEAYSMQIFLWEIIVMEYLLKENAKYIMSTDIARLFRNSNNTRERVENEEGKESKGIFIWFSASLMKATFYFLIVGYYFF